MNLLEELKTITREENILVNEPMKNHTTFRTGGVADFLAMPESKEEIQKLLALDCKKTIIGNGSNLLVKDGGIRGLVIQLTKYNQYTISDDVIEASAGCYLAKLSHVAEENGLTGLEFACGIPGTLGGAIVMNAGAYGGEISSVVLETEFISENGNIMTITDGEFGYRKSVFQGLKGIVLSSKLKLEHGNREEIKAKMLEYMTSRNAKQPVNFPSAGSTFKRPEGYFAGKLIEDAGLKGYQIGGAEVSTLHAGFIVNRGNASSKDILELIQYVQETIHKKYHVQLEPEVKIIGEDE
ncbi:MAG: UDP-N-acetylmuramate dehydrogenase [Clostridia bacterium]|nr:UDP-N-acetylmuramate dehydrogenase [Clostridia bacterium]